MTRAIICALLASVSAVISVSSHAQTRDGQNSSLQDAGLGSQIGDIVVTAQKRAERLNDVPLSITAATGEQLAAAGVKAPADLEKIVPGFAYQPTLYGTPVFTIRGIGFYDVSVAAPPAVSVYVDQVPLPYSAMAAGASLDVERVEALKGPQGTLFGLNSTGGAINFIAAKPTDEFKFGADLGYGRFNSLEAQAFISGPLTGNIGARLSVRTEQRDEWQRSMSRNDELGKRNFTTGRLLIDWSPSDAVRVAINANGWIDKSDTLAAQYMRYAATSTSYTDLAQEIQANEPAPDNSRLADWDPDTSLQRDDSFYQLSLRSDVDLGTDITLTSISGYSRLTQHAPNDTDGVPQNNFLMTVNADIESFSQELRLAGQTPRGNLRWMVGGNYGYDRTEDNHRGHYTATNSGIGPFRYNDFINSSRQRIESTSVFGSLEYSLTGNVKLQGSARYSDSTRKLRGCLYDAGDGALANAFAFLSELLTGNPISLPPGSCVTFGNGVIGQAGVPLPIVAKRLAEDNFSWRVGIDWKPNDQTLLYVNVTKGFKSGSFPTLPALTPDTFAPATQESVLAYEAGFKMSALNRRVQLTGAAFYYKYDDKQTQGFLPTTLFGNLVALINVPKASVRGAEIGLNLRPMEGLTFDGGATYVDAKVDSTFFVSDSFGNTIDIRGETLPGTPKWQLSGDSQYSFAVSDRYKLFIGATARYRSKAVAAFGDVPDFRLPSYSLVDVRAGLEDSSGRWKAQIYGRNIFNKFYLIHVTHNVDTVARTTGMPATYGISLSYRY
nr:TonB-dependent receptor [Sphingomonas sp. CDS-1]